MTEPYGNWGLDYLADSRRWFAMSSKFMVWGNVDEPLETFKKGLDKMDEPEIPKVSARLVPARGHANSPIIVVDECPFCGYSHRHGFDQQSGSSFGVRAADCGGGDYEMIDEATLPDKESRL